MAIHWIITIQNLDSDSNEALNFQVGTSKLEDQKF